MGWPRLTAAPGGSAALLVSGLARVGMGVEMQWPERRREAGGWGGPSVGKPEGVALEGSTWVPMLLGSQI